VSLLARARGRLYDWTWLHRFALAMGPSGLIAVLAGWITTEVGRTAWTVQRSDAHRGIGVAAGGPGVAASLLAFVVVYFAVFGAGVLYILKLMAKPPAAARIPPPHIPSRTAGTTPAAALRPDTLVGE